MINSVKAAIEASGEFNTVQLAQSREELLENFNLETPAVLLFYDKNKYHPSNNNLQVHQVVEKQLSCQLVCHTDQVDAKEQALVRAVIGYTDDSQHYPMEARESETHAISGNLYSRYVVFGTTTHIRQL